MKVDIFTLCDAAKVYEGKLSILGSFDAVVLSEVPAKYPAAAIAIKLRFERIEQGEKRIRISFIDADGKEILRSLEKQITVKVSDPFNTKTISFVIGMPGLKFQRFGDYAILLAVDGRIEAEMPLRVLRQNQL